MTHEEKRASRTRNAKLKARRDRIGYSEQLQEMQAGQAWHPSMYYTHIAGTVYRPTAR